MLKSNQHLSQWQDKYGGSISFLHSWSLSSILFTVDIATENHPSVFLPQQRQWLLV